MLNQDITWYIVVIAALAWLLACAWGYRNDTREDRRRELVRRCNAHWRKR